MPPTGRHLNKRSQHKGPLCEPRVREDEGRSAPVAGVLDDLTVIVQEVEIEGAGRARDTAPAPEVRLDFEEALHERNGIERPFRPGLHR